jgi:hypothetical protein
MGDEEVKEAEEVEAAASSFLSRMTCASDYLGFRVGGEGEGLGCLSSRTCAPSLRVSEAAARQPSTATQRHVDSVSAHGGGMGHVIGRWRHGPRDWAVEAWAT